MSMIKGKDTKPEINVRKYLFSKGYRFRLHVKELPGKPDIVLSKYKTIILINGCFWHGHKNCRYFKLPITNREFWKEKIEKNIERDKKNKYLLEKQGWKVLVIWECQLKNQKFEGTINKLIKEITNN